MSILIVAYMRWRNVDNFKNKLSTSKGGYICIHRHINVYLRIKSSQAKSNFKYGRHKNVRKIH